MTFLYIEKYDFVGSSSIFQIKTRIRGTLILWSIAADGIFCIIEFTCLWNMMTTSEVGSTIIEHVIPYRALALFATYVQTMTITKLLNANSSGSTSKAPTYSPQCYIFNSDKYSEHIHYKTTSIRVIPYIV